MTLNIKKKFKLGGVTDGGFTLIELLIVMAILGVLAVVVLVAINPVQQLARTRDSGRISSVVQLGHAVEAYFTAHVGVYPTNVEWIAAPNILVSSGEITLVPSLVVNTLNTPVCGAAPVNGWCFDADADSFVVFSRLEANTNLTLGACTTEAYTAYLSLAGRSCIVCAAPNANTAVADCQN